MRLYVPGTDEACLIDGWVHSYRQSEWARSMHRRTYSVTQRAIVQTVIERATTLVGCAPNDASEIYGWVCGEMQASRILLHYVWVKPLCRGLGVASELLAAYIGGSTLPVVTSHITDRARSVAMKRRRNGQLTCVTHPYVRYNPVLSLIPTMEVAL